MRISKVAGQFSKHDDVYEVLNRVVFTFETLDGLTEEKLDLNLATNSLNSDQL